MLRFEIRRAPSKWELDHQVFRVFHTHTTSDDFGIDKYSGISTFSRDENLDHVSHPREMSEHHFDGLHDFRLFGDQSLSLKSDDRPTVNVQR